MAHGTLREFDASKESIEDFHQRFEFYCLANSIKDGDEAQRNRKKALFITLVGQATFAKLRDLASPRDIVDLSLGDIMELLKTHYRPQTVEIAERYKFFKRTQGVSERTADFMAKLRRLAKTCNFGQYLETALRDQFVCGLRDEKCQRELLSIQDLTAEIAIRRATAAEVVSKETQAMRESATGPVMDGEGQLPLMGRDWMSLLQFDVVALMKQMTQVHQTSEDSMATEIMTEFADVFKDELGILKGIEAAITVQEFAPPQFRKPRPVPFALRDKVEKQLDKQW